MGKKRKIRLQEAIEVLWSYILLTMILLGLFFAGISISYRIISKNTEQTAMRRLAVLSETAYDKASCYAKICDVMAANSELLSFAAIEQEKGADVQNAVSFLKQEIANTTSIAKASPSDVEIYYPENERIVTMSGLFQGKEACAEWFESQFGGAISQDILRGIREDNAWAYFYEKDRSWIIRQVCDRSGTVAYIILEYCLDELVPMAEGEGIVLIGNDDSVVYGNLKELTTEAYRNLRTQMIESPKFNYEGEKYIASRCVFSMLRMDMTIAVSMNYITTGMKSFRMAVVWLGLFCLVSLIVLYTVLFRSVFLPYRYLAEATTSDSGNFRNVLITARQNLLSLKSQHAAMEEERKFLIHLGVGELLQRVCSVSEDSVNRVATRCLSLAGILPKQRYLLFAVFHLEDEQGMFQDMRDKRKQVTPLFVLDNIIQDLLLCERVGVVATVGRYYFILSTCTESDTDESLNEMVNFLVAFYRDNYHVTVAVTQPVIGKAAEDLRSVMRRTMNDISYLDFWHKDRIDSSVVMAENTLTSYLKGMRNLIGRLDNQDYQGAHQIFTQIMEENLPRSSAELQITKYRVYGMIEMLLSAISGQTSEDSINKLNYEARLYRVDNIASFKEEAESIFLELMDIRQKYDQSEGSAHRIEEIRDYIDAHYRENSLTATSVAERFEISGPYLSREFKKVIGCNMLEYIQKLRVEYTKKLLMDHSVKNAAQMAGFWDTQSLVRVFKKYEGVTPGEYKKMLEKEQKNSG